MRVEAALQQHRCEVKDMVRSVEYRMDNVDRKLQELSAFKTCFGMLCVCLVSFGAAFLRILFGLVWVCFVLEGRFASE